MENVHSPFVSSPASPACTIVQKYELDVCLRIPMRCDCRIFNQAHINSTRIINIRVHMHLNGLVNINIKDKKKMFQQTQRLRKTSGCYFFFTMTIPTKFYASTVRITSIQSKKEYQIYARSSSSFEQKGNLIICNEKKRMIICVYCNKLPQVNTMHEILHF